MVSCFITVPLLEIPSDLLGWMALHPRRMVSINFLQMLCFLRSAKVKYLTIKFLSKDSRFLFFTCKFFFDT